MELLILLLLSPALLTYGKSTNPNDEPFLPIYPVYPYSPKLIKRGTERDGASPLTPELYTPKVEARETYSANLGTNYARDPYYPTYNPYPKATTSTSYSPQYYGSNGYQYSTTPYNVYNSYSSTPYSSSYSMNQGYSGYSTIPYPSGSYPSYYYQSPYYYPNYYTQPMFAPPPPVSGYDYSNYKDAYTEADAGNKGNDKKTSDEKSKDADSSQESAAGSQFVDGGNYISGNSKDLDGQSSTQKAARPYNQLEQVSELSLKGLPLPLPKTTYRVISVAGQPVGPDYPLPATYARAQQLEQLMSQTIAKLLSRNPALQQQYALQQQQQQQQQHHQQQQQQQNSQYTDYDSQDALSANNNDASYTNANNYKEAQPYVSIPNVLAKTGLAYVINPTLIGKLSAGQATRQTAQPPTTLTTLTKSTDYSTQTLYDGSESSQKDQASEQQDDYGSYESQAPTATNAYDKQNQAYGKEQTQPQYQSQSYVTVRSPQSYNYQYTNYSPGQGHARKPALRYKSSLEDVNFGAKQTNKG